MQKLQEFIPLGQSLCIRYSNETRPLLVFTGVREIKFNSALIFFIANMPDVG